MDVRTLAERDYDALRDGSYWQRPAADDDPDDIISILEAVEGLVERQAGEPNITIIVKLRPGESLTDALLRMDGGE